MQKKAAVLGPEKKNRKPLMAVAACVCALLIGTGIYAFMGTGAGNPVSDDGTTLARTEQKMVAYPVSTFADGKARHYEYSHDHRTIRFFVLKSADGIIRAAFDACDVCWPAGKGYFQEGDQMVCRNCGRKFSSVKINEVKGGCNPAPLNRRIEGDQLVIDIKDIVEGKQYFDFSGKA